MTKQQILDEVKSLPASVQSELAEELRQLTCESFTAKQLQEIARRSESVDAGDMVTIPGEQVMREAWTQRRR